MSVYEVLSKIKRFINGEVSTNQLIKRGMKVGNDFHRGSGCFLDPTHCFLISIGNNVTKEWYKKNISNKEENKSHKFD